MAAPTVGARMAVGGFGSRRKIRRVMCEGAFQINTENNKQNGKPSWRNLRPQLYAKTVCKSRNPIIVSGNIMLLNYLEATFRTWSVSRTIEKTFASIATDRHIESSRPKIFLGTFGAFKVYRIL